MAPAPTPIMNITRQPTKNPTAPINGGVGLLIRDLFYVLCGVSDDLLALVIGEHGKQTVGRIRGANPSLIVAVPDSDGTVLMERGIVSSLLWAATLRAVRTGCGGLGFGLGGTHEGGGFGSDVLHDEKNLPHPLGFARKNRTKDELFSENSKAKERIEKEGSFVRDMKGSVVPHPAITIELAATKTAAELLMKNAARIRAK